MRSPTGLVPLYGDFGERCSSPEPGEADYRNGFWVRTVQNQGIVQVWAPLYTMFSRGNITEKARILGQGNSPLDGLDDRELGQRIGDVSVVDMYAGIGYFVFSYLRRGVGRVWGWEINGWSVEGLRRGCEANGWGCGVVRVKEGRVEGGIEELVKGLDESVRVVVFHGDNSFAAGILEKIRRVMGLERWKSVRHVNLGLLPSSSQAWESACRMVDSGKGGWVHVHENVDISHIDQKREQVRSELGRLWQQSHDRIEPASECRHVEMVKTYAPGVMHCVFDIQLLASR